MPLPIIVPISQNPKISPQHLEFVIIFFFGYLSFLHTQKASGVLKNDSAIQKNLENSNSNFVLAGLFDFRVPGGKD